MAVRSLPWRNRSTASAPTPQMRRPGRAYSKTTGNPTTAPTYVLNVTSPSPGTLTKERDSDQTRMRGIASHSCPSQ